jgi:hypothetical protein
MSEDVPARAEKLALERFASGIDELDRAVSAGEQAQRPWNRAMAASVAGRRG